MKKNNLLFTLVILLFISRSVFAYSPCYIPDKAKEKVVLFTDRSLYIVGEQIHFFSTLFSEIDTNKSGQSQMLYVELITPEGNKTAGNKYLIRQSFSEGCFTIPGDLLTGTYYLRAYTKFMRNYGPGSYEYKQIRIINPDRNEVLTEDEHENINEVQIIKTSKAVVTEMLSVAVDKTEYTPKDTISLSIQLIKGSIGDIKSLCLAVVPETTTSSLKLVQQSNEMIKVGTDYYPETHGISLTGKLTETVSQIPVKGKRVNLSIIGVGRDFMAVRTDSSGRFFFALPGCYGSRDLFLCAEKTLSADMKIWVDNDFCTTPFRLPAPAFYLTELERRVVYNMALNIKINQHFRVDTIPESKYAKDEEQAFYGAPTSILYLDQYVQLPTLEEYFNELPSLVRVRKRNGEKYFKIAGSQDLSFYDPLVLVDWVAIDEPAKILAVSPQNISRIEIVNQAYVKGGQTYGGIISIISKKGDFAGIDLPSSGIFINFRFLAENHCYDKVYDTVAEHPDVRNTLLWKPGFTIQRDQTEKYVITAPETPGKYNVIVEGITSEGKIFSTTSVFEVKN